MFMNEGDILGHEAMGIVEEVGREVPHLTPGDRVVVPFNISCGHCYMCKRELYAQCETTQVKEQEKGAALFGYTSLYGSVPGGQAEYLRVPQAQFGPIVVPTGPPDDRFLFLSDILPTAWQAIEYADVPPGGTVAIFGLGPVGHFCARIGKLKEHRVIGVDLEPERLQRALAAGVEVIDANSEAADEALLELTEGRGPDSIIDAVGMEAHGSPMAATIQATVGLLPDAIAAPAAEKAGLDRLQVLHTAIRAVRRGGTISVVGVYGGAIDPMPLMELFDKGITLRFGQAHVKRWVNDLMPFVRDDQDLLGVDALASHHLPLEEGPYGYEIFQKKEEGAFKIVLQP